jgi:hypothetical protein
MNPFEGLVERRVRTDPVAVPQSEKKRLRKNGHTPTSVYLSPKQREKFRQLGGSKWLQQLLDEGEQ